MEAKTDTVKLGIGLKLASDYKDNFMTPKERYEYANYAHRDQVKSLSSDYSVSLASSNLNKDTPKTKTSKPDIKTVIFNEKFAVLKPTKDSDYKINYVEPRKEDYRKKRTELFYPNYNEPSVAKDTKSEYKVEFK